MTVQEQPAAKSAASLLAVFALSVVVAVLAWSALLEAQFDGAFTEAGIEARVRLDRANASSLVAAKLQRAAAGPTVDIGVFGNSRAVQIRAEEMLGAGGDGASFFNFAIPGASFRNSVALVEALERAGRTPRTIAISIDNFYLEFDGAPVAAGPISRTTSFYEDLVFLTPRLREQPKELALLGWTFAWSEWTALREFFNFARLTPHPEAAVDGRGYRSDGSRPMPIDAAIGAAPIAEPRLPPQLHIAYLEHDVARLARIQAATGARILVYESPLLPSGRSDPDAPPDARETALRDRFAGFCRDHGVRCVLDRDGLGVDWPAGWRDATHAPSRPIGRALAELLAAADR